MAKKSMKEAATAGTSVFDCIATGTEDVYDVINAKNVQKVQYVKDAKDVKDVQKYGRPAKYEGEMVRLNLKLPADVKEYLTIAAAKASIEQRRSISLTEYLCDLITADRERHKDD